MPMKPAILERLRGVQRAGDGWLAFCPAHNDQHKRSLSVGVGADGRTLLKCHAAGCPVEQITAAVSMTLADLAPPSVNGQRTPQRRHEVATYDYRDERGELLYQVVRFEPKDFRPRRPDGNGGWTWNLQGLRRVVYRLHELAEAERAYLVEGEKDADRLVTLGLRATTTPGGAAAWRDEYADQLRRAGVVQLVALPDHDAAGRGYASAAAASCLRRQMAVKVVTLPGLAEHGDVSDWLDAGHTLTELTAIVDGVPWLEAAPETGPRIALTAEEGTIIWPDSATITFSRVAEHSRGVTAEVSVTWQDKELDYGTLNLLATRSRDGLVKKLDRAAPDVPWTDYLDLACRRMVTRLREGEPVEELQARPRTGETALIAPVLIEHESTVHYGNGGSGKSLDGLLCAIAARTGCALPAGLRVVHTVPAVMVLNWETNKSPQEARLHGLCRGLGITPPTGIYHRHMSGPLIDEARRLRADVARLQVGLVIVDSLAPASGPDPETAGAVVPVMNVLGSLPGVTRLVLAHVSHANEGARDPRPFGSVFVWNLARSCWYLQRSTEDRDDLVIGFYHKKANDERLHDALSLRFSFADGAITPGTADLAASPELQAKVPLVQQLTAALSNGAKSIPALALELDTKEPTIDKALRRHPGRFVQVPAEKPPFPWGLKAR